MQQASSVAAFKSSLNGDLHTAPKYFNSGWRKSQILQARLRMGCSSLNSVLSIYTERKKKRRVNFIPKFHSSLKKFVKYFTKRYMYGTKVPNFIGLWSTSLELLKFIGSYPANLEIKIKLKINIGCAPPPPPPPPSCCRCCPNSPLDRVNKSTDSSHRDVIPFIDQRIP